jgi:general secretion pathway protein G
VGSTGRIIVTGRRKQASAFAKASARRARVDGLAPGFTLMELLIVITLIVVLAGIAMTSHATSVRRAKEAVLKENLFRMNDALDQYMADKGTFPPDLSTLVTENYLRQIPKDPFTESSETWQVQMSEPDPSNPDAPPGVQAVKSGASGTGLDGTNYTDW